MHPSRRRKKRPNYGIKTVEVVRGSNGFGFTISGQQPCILSCIVANSPADQAGLRAGDFLISVNGISVSKIAHDAVVSLIGNCIGPIKMTIAENYFSDSSDEELECSRMVNTRKPKYAHKPRVRKELNRVNFDLKTIPKPVVNKLPERFINAPMEEEGGPIEYKALVGYLGTIEMPKQLLPNSRLPTVCSCIRKLRQEKRVPTAILMTILPTCLTLKNSANQILAIYPTNRVVYVSSTADKESRYFGLVTTAISETRANETNENWNLDKKHNNETVEISNSCHVFAVDPKIIDHNIHSTKAEMFKIACTRNTVNGHCMEFPENALYVVSLIQNMYKLQNNERNENLRSPLMANSPQPSASSNSDSGIGFRDDCGNISDRILVVEFPHHRSFPVHSHINRPSGIDASNIPLEGIDIPFRNNNLQKSLFKPNDSKQLNNLNNIRDCESNDQGYGNIVQKVPTKISDSSDDNTQNIEVETYRERAIDCPDSPQKLSLKEIAPNLDSKCDSCDDVSMHSSKSNELSNLLSIFKVPFETKKAKKSARLSCHEHADKRNFNYKLNSKYMLKANYSCEELNTLENNFNIGDKLGYGSLQNLTSHGDGRKKSIINSEPDVRINKDEESCDGQNFVKCIYPEGPSAWEGSFEKLLADPLGLHMFAEFLKKEFSAENIYFWISCERFKALTSENDRRNEAQRIYRQHLSAGASEAVNVDAPARQGVERHLQGAGVDLLQQAQKQIFNLMKFDSYPRFIKSDIFRRCLNGETDKVELDVRLLVQTALSPTKLKKSVSNAEDRRRKSLLPWHRKNRSKSKDRGEIEYTKKDNDSVDFSKNGDTDTIHSSGSSLTSLDLAIPSQDLIKQSKDTIAEVARTSLCRVFLSSGSTTVVQIKSSETIQELVTRLLEKRGLNYSSFEVYTDKHLKSLNVEDPSISLAGCEVIVEQRVVFRLDLPNRKMISIRSKYTKIISDVLRPSLYKYQYNLDQMVILNGNVAVDVNNPVTAIDGMRLKVQYKDDVKQGNVNSSTSRIITNKIKLEEITNKVFEGILQEKSSESSVNQPQKSDKESVKSEDWCSEHSSTFMGKFLKRECSTQEKKKKIQAKYKAAVAEITRDIVTKKPLIAKMTTGANKFNFSCSESEELVEGLTRAQRRIEDQRGTEINFEMPDFLKNKENDQQHRPNDQPAESNAKFYLGENSAPANIDKSPVISSAKNMKLELQSNYENRTVTVPPPPPPLGKEAKPSRSNETNGVAEQVRLSSMDKRIGSEPPPLPPKPKVVPIKPPNWGHFTGFYKKDVSSSDGKSQTMFLEQTTSSFV
ncbi:unnamed protein product [Phyllotreta striolata]|uniref:Regulator of G-protein signaling loco n=1 Tax=Phyllotreta striolata TaxID=444603 RepID=A0A9N9TUD8_PHYSR|nr:unnamed protein product [Phyllotreta striolata]